MQTLANYGDDLSSRLPAGSSIKYEIAFNANGISLFGGYDSDPLVPHARDDFSRFAWVSHTFTHTNLNALSQSQCNAEITQNSDAAATLWGTPPGSAFDPSSMVTPQISGLFNGPCLQGIDAAGVNTFVGDNSRPELRPTTSDYHGMWTTQAVNGFDGGFIVPRHVTNIYYDNSLPENNVAHYNHLASTSLTFEEFMALEASTNARHLLKYRPDPFMFHQSNTISFDWTGAGSVGGKASLLSLWTEAIAAEVTKFSKLPIRSIPQKEMRQRLLTRMATDECKPQGHLVIDGGEPVAVVVSSEQACTVPVSGPASFAAASGLPEDLNGPEGVVYVSVTPASPVTVSLGSGDPTACDGAPCLNGGTCAVDGAAAQGFTCTCADGYTGDTCELPPCAASPCQNGGTCTTNAAAEGGYSCSCPATHFGTNCETFVCDLEPCQNGGTCSGDAAAPSGFTCACATGFAGATCSDSVACDAAPCQNGGTCTNDAAAPGGFTCACPTSHSGADCSVSACDAAPCQNGGTCVLNATVADGYMCTCATGFTGATCGDSAACAANPCQNGGTCTADASAPGGYVCACPTSHYGTDCATSVCSVQPCQNGGTCTIDASVADGFTCACATHFSGDRCEVVSPCAGEPCLNGGTCAVNAGATDGYTCTCPVTHTGATCAASVCDSAPCQNGGTCSLDAGAASGYTCACATGYAGATCTESTSCAGSPCLNGGTCTENAGGYTCTCTGDYTGDTCATPAVASTLHMRVLVLGTQTEDHYEVSSVIKVLHSRGMPYTFMNAVTDLAGGAPLELTDPVTGEGLYNGIITATSELGYEASPGVWQSALTTDQWTQLFTYMGLFRVRRVSLYSWPSFRGIVPAAATAAGTHVGLESWLEEADPSYVAGARPKLFDSFSTPADVSGAAEAVVAARVYNSDDVGAADTGGVAAATMPEAGGGETLHFFFALSQWRGGQVAVVNVALQWLVHGTFVGQRRVLLNAQIDDLYLESPEWLAGNTYGPNTRCSPTDLALLKAYQDQLTASGVMDPTTPFLYEWAFNANGVDLHGGLGVDPLATATQDMFQDFYWVSHTHTHTNLDALSKQQCKTEAATNLASAHALWGNPPGPEFGPSDMVTPQISGLFNGPCLEGLAEEGIHTVVGDNSRPELRPTTSDYHGMWTTQAVNGYDGTLIIPRHATNIYFDNSQTENNLAHFNFITNWGYTWEQFLQAEADAASRNMLLYRPDPYMFHQANTVAIPSTDPGSVDGQASLLSLWTQAAVNEYRRFSNFPIRNLPMHKLRDGLLARMARDECQAGARVQVDSAGVPINVLVDGVGDACEIRVSGAVGIGGDLDALPAGVVRESYGPEETLVMSLGAGQSVSVPASGGTGGATPPPPPPPPPTTCPNDCSGHGTCNLPPTCVCSEGWRGVDCSVEITYGWSANLLLNPGFETVVSRLADAWEPVGTGYRSVRDKHTGARAIRLSNAAATGSSAAYQAVYFTPALPAGTKLRLSAWSKAKSVTGVPDYGYAMSCDLEHTDGTGTWGVTAQFDVGTHGYAQSVTVHTALKPVKEVWCYAQLLNHAGIAKFDDLDLRVEQEGGVQIEDAGSVQALGAAALPTGPPVSVDGRCGAASPSNAVCPTGECCSDYGWCGVGDDFCRRHNGCRGCAPGTAGPCIDPATGVCSELSSLTGTCAVQGAAVCDQFTHIDHVRGTITLRAVTLRRVTAELRAFVAEALAAQLALPAASVKVDRAEGVQPAGQGVRLHVVVLAASLTQSQLAEAVAATDLVTSLRTAGDQQAQVQSVAVEARAGVPEYAAQEGQEPTSAPDEPLTQPALLALIAGGVALVAIVALAAFVRRRRHGGTTFIGAPARQHVNVETRTLIHQDSFRGRGSTGGMRASDASSLFSSSQRRLNTPDSSIPGLLRGSSDEEDEDGVVSVVVHASALSVGLDKDDELEAASATGLYRD